MFNKQAKNKIHVMFNQLQLCQSCPFLVLKRQPSLLGHAHGRKRPLKEILYVATSHFTTICCLQLLTTFDNFATILEPCYDYITTIGGFIFHVEDFFNFIHLRIQLYVPLVELITKNYSQLIFEPSPHMYIKAYHKYI